MTFTAPVVVRGYELDTQGHLNQSVYLQYAEHARWEILRAAGIDQNTLVDGGAGPVVLETTIKYLRELRGGDEVTVSCGFEFGPGKAFTVRQEIRKHDGTLVTDIVSVGGMLDLAARKLIANPAQYLRQLAKDPEILGL